MSFRGPARGRPRRRRGGIGRVVRRTRVRRTRSRGRCASRGIEVREGVRVEGDRRRRRGAVAARRPRARCGRASSSAATASGSVVRKSLGLGAGQAARAGRRGGHRAGPAGTPIGRSCTSTPATDRSAGYAWDFPTVVDGRPLVCRGVYRLKVDGEAAADEGPDVAALLAARLRAQGIDPARCKNKRYAERGLRAGDAASRVGPSCSSARPRGSTPSRARGSRRRSSTACWRAASSRGASRASERLARRSTSGSDEVGASRLARDLRIRTRLRPPLLRAVACRRWSASSPRRPMPSTSAGQHFAAQPLRLAQARERDGAGSQPRGSQARGTSPRRRCAAAPDRALRREAIEHARERDGLAHVRQAADPRDRALDARGRSPRAGSVP